MEVKNNFYWILGVPQNAMPIEIKKAYKKLALIWHTDRHVNSPVQVQNMAKNMFQKIAEAYEVLIDQDKRTAYDNMLSGGGSSSCQTRQRHFDETQTLASAQASLAQLLRSNGGSMGGNVLPKMYRKMYGFDLYYFGYKNLTELMKTVPGVVVHPNPTGKGFNSFTLSERSVPLYIQESIRYILGKQPESKISGSGFVHTWAKQYPTYPPFSYYWKSFGFSSQTKCIEAVSGVKILPGTPEYYLLLR